MGDTDEVDSSSELLTSEDTESYYVTAKVLESLSSKPMIAQLVEKEIRAFTLLMKNKQAADSVPILIFPLDLSPVVTKCVRYFAGICRLTPFYVRIAGKEAITLFSPDHLRSKFNESYHETLFGQLEDMEEVSLVKLYKSVLNFKELNTVSKNLSAAYQQPDLMSEQSKHEPFEFLQQEVESDLHNLQELALQSTAKGMEAYNITDWLDPPPAESSGQLLTNKESQVVSTASVYHTAELCVDTDRTIPINFDTPPGPLRPGFQSISSDSDAGTESSVGEPPSVAEESGNATCVAIINHSGTRTICLESSDPVEKTFLEEPNLYLEYIKKDTELVDQLSRIINGTPLFVTTQTTSDFKALMKRQKSIVELYDIPADFRLILILSHYPVEPRIIVFWCDSSHAILIYRSPEQVKRALKVSHRGIMSRRIRDGSPIATIAACSCNLERAFQKVDMWTPEFN